jgi:hypothetical protein
MGCFRSTARLEEADARIANTTDKRSVILMTALALGNDE